MRKLFLKWQTDQGIKAGWVDLPDLPDETLISVAKELLPDGILETDKVIFIGELINQVETKTLFSIQGAN